MSCQHCFRKLCDRFRLAFVELESVSMRECHELQHMLTLQSQQQADLYEKVGYAVATAAIFRGLEQYYQSR